MTDERQRIVRVTGSRRAQLTAVPGTMAEPAVDEPTAESTSTQPAGSGPNDDRLRRDVPPHY